MVRKTERGSTQVVQRNRDELHQELIARGANRQRTQADTIGHFYAAGATTEIVSGLFARRCVLVEGPTEALALPEFLRARGLNVLQEGIAVVSAEGIGNIAKWHRLYTALGISSFASSIPTRTRAARKPRICSRSAVTSWQRSGVLPTQQRRRTFRPTQSRWRTATPP
jgi:hypothetical protein